MLANLLGPIVSLIYPRCCEVCGEPPSPDGAAGPGICPSCRARILRLRPPFCGRCGRPSARAARGCSGCSGETFDYDTAYACAYYEGPMKDLLHRYKFSGRRALADLLGGELLAFSRAHLSGMSLDAVAAVPTERARRWVRGFDQTAPLARALSAGLGLPDLSKHLARLPSASAQSALGKAQRRSNVAGRFRVRGRLPRSARSILLVDDILTTGRTASECARTLKAAGTASVTVLACARGR